MYLRVITLLSKYKHIMNTILVNTVLGKVENIEAILPKEFAKVEEWKSAGILAHLFLKENGAGAVLVFNETNEDKVRALITELPLYAYFTQMDFTVLEKQF